MARKTEIAAHRQRLTLQEPLDLPDGIGGVTRDFVVRANLWGKIESMRGSERAEAQMPAGSMTHRITLRWRADVTTAMRFSAQARLYVIHATYDPDGRRRDLVCFVEEMQP